jgi:hypothetical protein
MRLSVLHQAAAFCLCKMFAISSKTLHFMQVSKAKVLFRSLLGKRWHAQDIFYGSWEEVPAKIQHIAVDYQTAIQVLTGQNQNACFALTG